MHHRSRQHSRLRASLVSIAISISLLMSLFGPFVIRKARAQLPTPTPLPAGQPPGPNLPNLDVMRTLQSVTPVLP